MCLKYDEKKKGSEKGSLVFVGVGVGVFNHTERICGGACRRHNNLRGCDKMVMMRRRESAQPVTKLIRR